MKTIVVLSGGMDSATALSWAINEGHEVVGLLSFWYGSKHNDMEWSYAEKIASHYNLPIKRCRLDFIADTFKSDLLTTGGYIPLGHYESPTMKSTVVPFRNGIMLSIAAGYAESLEAESVVLGNHFGDHAIYPDCRKAFIEPMASAISEGTYVNIKLLSPFSSISKTDIVKIGASLGTPYNITYSCYNGGEKHCGECGTCYERKEAFRDACITDPTEYLK